ncbi:hypothetical protein AVEN_220829-1 [Araneus ventricosus]|uniref:Uncharacterized protein n=1 Tax=Araneus ventricosus TaxID=182803 RepID=A0A4Y2FQ81_ARAVE|nr:hypothetical protein AVEN_220829-1 [Araneus ventricosus]
MKSSPLVLLSTNIMPLHKDQGRSHDTFQQSPCERKKGTNDAEHLAFGGRIHHASYVNGPPARLLLIGVDSVVGYDGEVSQ